MRANIDDIRANGSEKLVGPWPCERCGKISQFAVVQAAVNKVFCRNESCRFTRVIDKQRSRIVEADGSVWAFDNAGNKWRVRE